MLLRCLDALGPLLADALVEPRSELGKATYKALRVLMDKAQQEAAAGLV
jgi:hypothetical protein